MLSKKQPDERLPTPHKTLNRWFGSVALVEKLREIVATESFMVAVAVLKNATKPTFRTTMARTPEENAARFAWYAGYCDALDDLEKLAVTPANKPQSEPVEWTHIEL
jgi:hypothetical protein